MLILISISGPTQPWQRRIPDSHRSAYIKRHHAQQPKPCYQQYHRHPPAAPISNATTPYGPNTTINTPTRHAADNPPRPNGPNTAITTASTVGGVDALPRAQTHPGA